MSAHRLLVITYHFGSNGAVGGLRWTGITKYLVRLGWEVKVITAAPPEHASVESSPALLDDPRCLPPAPPAPGPTVARVIPGRIVEHARAGAPGFAGQGAQRGRSVAGLSGREPRLGIPGRPARALSDPAVPAARRRQQRSAALRPPRGGGR